jgi:hypothetical protein
MIKYEIREICGDWGIFEMRWGANGWEDATEECLLILNSRTNAEYIKAILEHEARHPNAAVPYRPDVADMSDEECLAVFRLCCAEENHCKTCPLNNLGGGCFLHIDRRVLAMAERAVEPNEGEWLDTGDEELDKIYSGYKCSVCGFVICGHSGKYCPECGAKMKGVN